MPLTYSTLQTQIADTLNRDDLTAAIPNFIILAEASSNRDVRHWQMQKRSTATFNERYEPLPTDWLETVRVSISGKRQLDLLSQAKMMDLRETNGNTSGEPRYYTHSAAQLELYPTPDSDYDATLIYYARVAELSDSAPSNWLLVDSPDIYLYGALVHTAPFLQEDNRLAVWQTMYKAAVDRLNERSEEGLHSGSGLTIR
jgi:hypothetical protein